MTEERIKSLMSLCEKYMNGGHDEAYKKYIALEVLDAYKSGELQKLLTKV
jgi:hypothetical protein